MTIRKILYIALLSVVAEVAWAIAPPNPRTATAETWAAYQAFWEEMQANTPKHAPARVGVDSHGNRPFAPTHIPVIMVNFSNYSLVSTKTQVDSIFNAVTPPMPGFKGSVATYFNDQSYGAYRPTFDIYGPVTLQNNYAYYGAGHNTSAHANEMVAEACYLMDDSLDFSQYDKNNDGKVDLVFIYFAGFGENDPPQNAGFGINSDDLVWPHYSTISGSSIGGFSTQYDGKTIRGYECANELDGYESHVNAPFVSGPMTLCHEFGHGLGLPDMYTTNNASHKTLGSWSLMSYCYGFDYINPTSMNAYEKWWLGWMEPQKLACQETDTLRALSLYPEAYYFTPDDSEISNVLVPGNGRVFYILENRQKVGWDAHSASGNGLLLYKILYNAGNWSANQVNNVESAMGVDILEADGITPRYNGNSTSRGWYGKQGDCYPYINGTDTLDSIMVVPSLPITHIRIEGRDIIFDVCGGQPQIPTALETLCQPENESQTNSNPATLIYRNGQIYIIRNNHLYSITGQLCAEE